MIESIRAHQPTGLVDQEDRSLVKSMGRTFRWIKDKLDPITILAHCLFFLAARAVVFTSSRTFKESKCDYERVARSRQTLQTLGGQEVNLPMPDGHQMSAMYLDTKRCLEKLIELGGEKGRKPLANGLVQDILFIPPHQTELCTLIERMGLPLHEEEGRQYIHLGIPKILGVPEADQAETMPGTVIYAPGSGHIFEYRRPTIGTFMIGYGMNMLVFHYSQTGQSEGKISEQATYDNVEAAYRYLKQKDLPDQKILGYGHCMGGGPILELASKYPIALLLDRVFADMGDFAKLRATRRLPRFLHFLAEPIKRVMNRCFNYDNRKKIEHVQGRVALIEAARDEIIPGAYIQELYDHAMQAQTKVKLVIDSDHDRDLVSDESARLSLGRFLTESNLIGNFV